MSELICCHCGTIQDELSADVRKEYLSNGGYHLIAYCCECQKFIKNLPHSTPQVLHFGKHKGKSIAEIANEDESYLRWLSGQDIKESLKSAILSTLEKKNARPIQNSLSLS
jgi:uncharacterized protein (DUF3820 family)